MKKVKSQKKMSAQDERLVGMVRVLALLITDYCTRYVGSVVLLFSKTVLRYRVEQ